MTRCTASLFSLALLVLAVSTTNAQRSYCAADPFVSFSFLISRSLGTDHVDVQEPDQRSSFRPVEP